jgi:hypothetical protein
MRRFTILGLMGLILGLAVSIAALRNADDQWAGALLLTTALLIGAAALGAVYHSGRRRAARLGFAVFGGGYFALAFLGLSESNLTRLPTTWLLRYVHDKVAPAAIYASDPFDALEMIGGTSSASVPSGGATLTMSNHFPIRLASVATTTTPNRWKFMLPGAANYDAFGVVGHCLFALLAGLLGIVIATRYQARQDSVWLDQ